MPKIRARIPPRLRPRLDEEDVLHEAFLRAFESIHTFRPSREDSFPAWVYRIAKNLITDVSRRRSAAALHFSRDEDQKGPRASEIAPPRRPSPETRFREREWIEVVLTKLPEKEAEVIRRRSLLGSSFEEIADSWKKTPGTVQRFFSRAWHRFREIARLDSEDVR